MTHRGRYVAIAAAIVVAVVLVARYATDRPVEPQAKSEVASRAAARADTPVAVTAVVSPEVEAAAVQEFEARVAEFTALHKELDSTLPSVPDKATPEQIEKHQQDIAALIVNARANAKQGEFFTPGVMSRVTRAMTATFTGAEGASNKAATMEDNPGATNVHVNSRYPDGIPYTSMPIELLETLPKVGEELEYRFLGKRLVLLDSCAQIILDITPNVMP